MALPPRGLRGRRERAFFESLETRQLFSTGQLDLSFGSNGSTTVDGAANTSYTIGDVALQAVDQRIVVAGIAQATIAPKVYTYSIFLNRYNTDGSLDASFGTAGQELSFTSDMPTSVNELLVEPSGKLLVVGGLDFGYGGYIAQLESDGAPDPTFGAGGIVTVPTPYRYDGWGLEG